MGARVCFAFEFLTMALASFFFASASASASASRLMMWNFWPYFASASASLFAVDGKSVEYVMTERKDITSEAIGLRRSLS